ncbi:hypothetical protein N4P33_22580 [Streptomyces sp. 15-116A]|uniref:hypothetical protein n=1 Tax=Streptomyces sp. 15-116A TaxID=2259035 RepID=UPI0021B3C4DB|nr:hypothetical protein [Streptomyces sp. 15-116A]MCT7354919.1 hypothetical protein [Streptomyces sp. 15-116A]
MWGRKRTRRERVDANLEAVEQTLGSTDRAHEGLMELVTATADEIEAVQALLGGRDGVPVDAISRQLEAALSTLGELQDVSQQYLDNRERAVAELRNGIDAALPWLEVLVEQADGMAEAGEELVGMTQALAGVRVKTERLRGELVPLRERVHAAVRAALGELHAAQGAEGWYGWQAELAALGDRLTALDEGRVVPTPEFKIGDRYRVVEREVATLRDAMARAVR